MKTWNAFFVLMFCLSATAETYKYSSLIIKDYDEMNRMVQSRVRKARSISDGSGEDSSKDAEAIENLRDALKLIFSRPNSDNMIAKLTPDVRKELVGFSAFEDSISSLVAEALGVVKDKNATVTQQSTSLFILENILGEIRPEAAKNADLRRVVERIAEADIEVSKDVIKDRKLRSMFATKSPSEEAKKILKGLPKPAESKEKKL